jgi:hypothetical protein
MPVQQAQKLLPHHPGRAQYANFDLLCVHVSVPASPEWLRSRAVFLPAFLPVSLLWLFFACFSVAKNKKPVALWCRSTGCSAASSNWISSAHRCAHTTDLPGRLTRFRSVWCFIVNMRANMPNGSDFSNQNLVSYPQRATVVP